MKITEKYSIVVAEEKKKKSKYPKNKQADQDEDESYIIYTTGKRDLQLGDQYKAFKKLMEETEGKKKKK